MLSLKNEEWRLMIIIIDVLNISYLTVFLKYDLKYELAVL